MLIPVILADTLAFGRRRMRSSAECSGKGGEPTCIGFVGAAPSAVVIVEADTAPERVTGPNSWRAVGTNWNRFNW